MANFAYTNNTTFKPFSFQEMLQPLAMYTEAHREVENAYSELDSQANAIVALANETNDPITYQKYKAYESALREQADILATQGLTPGSRKSLLDLKGRYAKDITPIQNAITRRRALQDEQRKALLSNPTLMFQRNFNELSYDTSLDRFLDNPDYDYGEQYSGALITKQVSDMSKHLAKELRGTSTGRLDDYTKTFLQKYGLSSGEVLQAINNPNDPKSSKALRAIYDSAVGAVPKSIRERYADDVNHYASMGFWDAVGQDKISTFEDYGARLDAQGKGKGNPLTQNGYGLNPTNIYSSRKQEKAAANIRNFSKYFTNNDKGETVITPEGIKEYRRNANQRITTAGSGSGTARLMNLEARDKETGFTPTKFREFLDGLGIKPERGIDFNLRTAELGSAWDKYLKDNDTSTYDATKYTEYVYSLDKSAESQKNYKAKMLEALGNRNTIREVDLNSETGKFEPINEGISKADLLSDDYTIVSRRPSELGSTVMIMDKEGNVKRYEMPGGIHKTAEDARDAAIQGKLVAQRKLMDPTLSPEKRLEWKKAYDVFNQQQIMYESQLDYVNTTKDQEFKVFYNP